MELLSDCYPDPQRDNSQDNLPATSGSKSTSNNNERPSRNFENVPPRRFGRLQPVDPGEGTKYGQPFQIECRAPNEAFSRMEVQLVSGPDGNDLLFNFSCTPVTGESQVSLIGAAAHSPVITLNHYQYPDLIAESHQKTGDQLRPPERHGCGFL